MAREGIFSDSKFVKIADLPGAATPGPGHFARILVGGMKAEVSRMARQGISSESKFEKIAAPGPHHFDILIGCWIGA